MISTRLHSKRIALIFVSILLISSISIAAEDKSENDTKATETPTYRVGAKSIAFPPPTSDLVEAGSDYRVILEPFAPSSNRLIAAYLTPEDEKVLQTGKFPAASIYALVESVRAAEFVDVDSDAFKQVTDAVSKQFSGDMSPSINGEMDELNRRLKALSASAPDLAMDKPLQLGNFFSKPDAAAYGMVSTVSGKGASRRMIVGLAVLRVRNRIIFSYLYTDFKDESTVKWMKETTEKWADAILAANK